MATRANVPFVIIDTVCEEGVLLDRISTRQQQGNQASDAGEAIYRRQRAELERVPLIVPAGAISATVDTSADGPVNLDPVIRALMQAELLSPVGWAEE